MNVRPHTSLIIIVGLSPCIALSLLSFFESVVWKAWSDAAFLTRTGAWAPLVLAGCLLLITALVSRSQVKLLLVVAIAIAVQLPGIVSHTQFQWMWLAGHGAYFAEGPSVMVVGLALIATPIGIYSLWTAVALEKIGTVLIQAGAGTQGINEANRGNSLLLMAVMAVALAMGVIALAPLWGLSGTVTASISRFGPALIWMSVAASALTLGIIYSFLHGKWWSRSALSLPGNRREPASTPDGP